MSKKKPQSNQNYEKKPLEETIEDSFIEEVIPEEIFLEENNIEEEIISENIVEKDIPENEEIEELSNNNETHIEKKVAKKAENIKERHYPHGHGKVLFIFAPRQIVVACNNGNNYTLCGSYENVHIGDEIDF